MSLEFLGNPLIFNGIPKSSMQNVVQVYGVLKDTLYFDAILKESLDCSMDFSISVGGVRPQLNSQLNLFKKLSFLTPTKSLNLFPMKKWESVKVREAVVKTSVKAIVSCTSRSQDR